MRFGITILTDRDWATSSAQWRRAEELGFDHAWTYDHLVWGGLPDSDWYGTIPTLTAAAMVTSQIRLGTFVSSPNYRHPYLLFRDLLALQDISGDRFLMGIGVGGDRDSAITGGPDLGVKQRVDRYFEFVTLLDRLRTEDHVTFTGDYFSVDDARTLPGLDVPLLLAANGPRTLRFAAKHSDGWITYGKADSDEAAWWTSLAELSTRLTDLGAPEGFSRILNLDARRDDYSLASVQRFTDMVGRAEELGFTDVVTHWPRPEDPYQGSLDVLETVAAQIISPARQAG